MNCNEAAEFVSALCDGERIPSDAAVHVGDCETCQARMKEYIELGVEMRRVASLQAEEVLKPMAWEPKRASISSVWQKGWETMRIPRFAFAALVIGILALGSSLAIDKVRAHSDGTVVVLAVNNGSGDPVRCSLSTVDKSNVQCADLGLPGKNWKMLGYQISLLGRDGNRVRLGVRTKVYSWLPGSTTTMNLSDFTPEPQKEYWFEPGETLRVEVADAGVLSLTGEWTDHIPTQGALNAKNHNLDPGPEELRVVSPLLLRDKRVVGDMEGGISIATEPDQGVMIYFPGEGSFILSLQKQEGAIEGEVNMNRICFKSDGRNYRFLTAEPIARGTQVWILHDQKFNPGNEGKAGFISGGKVNAMRLRTMAKQ